MHQVSRAGQRRRRSLIACGAFGLVLASCAPATPTAAPAAPDAPSALPAPAPGTSSAIYVPPTSAGAPTSTSVRGPVGPYAVAAHPAPSRGVGPPEGSPITGIRRDCGISTTLANGRALWIYCDTGIWGADERLGYFLTTTAAIATPETPLTMRDALDADVRPTQFLTTGDDYPVCRDGARRSAWPMSAITVPGDGVDRVLIWYHNVCLVPRTSETFDVGLAEIDIPADQSTDIPLVARVVTPRLFARAGPGGSFGSAAEYFEGQAYLWWCDLGATPCFLARAPIDHVQEREAYTYWTGSDWSGDEATKAALPLGSTPERISLAVRWVPALATFAMLDMDGWGRLDLRFASRPEGPWSAAETTILEECTRTYPENCFAGMIHAHLSGPDHLTVGFFDPSQPFGTGRSTRVADVALTPRP